MAARERRKLVAGSLRNGSTCAFREIERIFLREPGPTETAKPGRTTWLRRKARQDIAAFVTKTPDVVAMVQTPRFGPSSPPIARRATMRLLSGPMRLLGRVSLVVSIF